MNGRLISLCIIVLLGFAAGCGRDARYVTANGPMLGTTFVATGDVRCSAPELFGALMELDREAKASMSIFDPESLLSRLNDNRTDSLDRHILHNLRLAERISRLSGGRYDVTVGPLVEAWGFAGHDPSLRPDTDSILQFVGYRRIGFDGGRLVKEDPRIRIDLNSIAKGYTVDLAAELMERLGARNYLVDIGGECRCKGVNPQGGPWRIGIETPFDGNCTEGDFLTARVRMSGGALATSGNYRRFYLDAEGNKVAHTIDPITGRSALSRLLSATVAAESCAEADALATMYMSLGADAAIALAERCAEARVYFILDDGRGGYETYCSPAMRRMMMASEEH
ncbi:MAG: FAD:protein FMN transferase [Alistipes sp.]|nr:FAD:protein FMN transferase [Alistipes sp.]